MAMRLLVDSSVFLSALLETDVHYADSKEFFGYLKEREVEISLVIPATVILEITNVLVKLGHPAEAGYLPRRFPTLETIAIDDEFAARAVPVLERVRLKTADAIIAIAAFLEKATLISWDKKLLAEAGKIVPSATPAGHLETALKEKHK